MNRRAMMAKAKTESPYQLVEWIEGTGTQGIVTDFHYINPTTVILDAMPTTRTLTKTQVFCGFGTLGSGWFGHVGNTNNIGVANNVYFGNMSLNTRYQYNCLFSGENGTKQTIEITANGGTISSTAGMATSRTPPMSLFCGYDTKADFFSDLRVYSLKAYQNDSLVLDLRPAYKKNNGEIGLYDTVSDSFFPNVGTGTFLKGNDIL